MLLTKEVKIKCNNSNKNFYLSKGYDWSPNGFMTVNINDVSKGSNILIECLCDYCLEQGINTIINITFYRYNQIHKGEIKKDCCMSCINLKRKEVMNKKYGVDYCNQAYSNKQKDIHKFDELFNQKNVKPLVDTYVNEKELLPFLCLVHNIEVKKSIARLKRINIICQECMNEYRRNLYQEDESVVFSEFKKHNLIILDNEKYVNSKTPIKCICEYHPDIVQEIAYYNLKFSYGRCRLCIVEGRRGENNPNWKGGITSENHKNRASEEYIEWRNKVYERDNYTCQCCGDSTGGNLQAHHIENFSTNEELRFDVNNGITLCDLCHNPNKHGSFHNIYGTYNNNKNQLVEYINKYNNGEFETVRLKNVI